MHRPILALLFLAGCASLTEAQCRGDAAEWQALGEYDSIQGDQPWIEAYGKVCAPYGAQPDQQAYMEGWWRGHAEFERRVAGGV